MTGLMTGFGAASADAVYGLLVALGFGLAASALLGYAAYLQIVGGVLLLFLGIAPLFQKTYYGNQSQIHANETKKISKAFAFGSTFALTLTNPLTILSFIGAIAALSEPPRVYRRVKHSKGEPYDKETPYPRLSFRVA